MISALTTQVQGLKIKNTFDLNDSSQLMVGIDTSNRNWDGTYEKSGAMAAMITGRKSIDDVDTTNRAIFAELEKTYASTSIKAGLRYDNTHIETDGSQPDNNYTGIGASLFANYQLNDSTRLFAGIGRANRVPDARELYFQEAMGMTQPEIGNPDLDQTVNTELDLGVEKRYQNASVKAKIFYSSLTDYIYYNSDKATNKFENIDATIYGINLSGNYFVSDEVYLDYGYAQQVGKKDKPLAGQTDTDLAEIPPYKINIALNIDYVPGSTASIAAVNTGAWSNYDSDNGEQRISGYTVFNFKVNHAVNRSFDLAAGIDNILDTTYTTTNTYQDLTLLADGSGDVMQMNEPGRYLYVNASYRF
jgi:iron complex outermembrane receptor protein